MYMTFFRRRSTPVSTVLQKLVRFFIDNKPVFLIKKNFPSWNLENGLDSQQISCLNDSETQKRGLWRVTIQKLSWGSMPLDPPRSLPFQCLFRKSVCIYCRSTAAFRNELIFLSFKHTANPPLSPPPNKPSLLRGRKLIRSPSFLSSPSPPSYYYSLTNGRHYWSITALKLCVEWSRMVHSPAGSPDLFLIPSCMTFNFLYLSFSTFYGELIP